MKVELRHSVAHVNQDDSSPVGIEIGYGKIPPMTLLERVKLRRAEDASLDLNQSAALELLQNVLEAAQPVLPEDEAEVLGWIVDRRLKQIEDLKREGLMSIAKEEEKRLQFLASFRSPHSYGGVLLRPGVRVYCDDRDHLAYDCLGTVTEVIGKSVMVSFDGPGGTRNSPHKMSLDQVAPSDTDATEIKFSSWDQSPLAVLLDLRHTVDAALQQRLSIFLCHGSEDKSKVRELHKRLKLDGFRPWLDSEDLVPGDDWETAIRIAVRKSDIVLVCLSKSSTSKIGFVNKEIKYALDAADERPEGDRYLIPGLLEPCDVPNRISPWHWVRLYEVDGYDKLVAALRSRASAIGKA